MEEWGWKEVRIEKERRKNESGIKREERNMNVKGKIKIKEGEKKVEWGWKKGRMKKRRQDETWNDKVIKKKVGEMQELKRTNEGRMNKEKWKNGGERKEEKGRMKEIWTTYVWGGGKRKKLGWEGTFLFVWKSLKS